MDKSVNLAAAVEILRKGELVAFPTETVYGLGADATDDLAVARVYAVKGRPSFNPLITHVASRQEAETLGVFSAEAQKLADAFWPGPLTLAVRRTESCAVSRLASAGLSSLALRVPRHPLALQLLNVFGKPLVAPSANPSGQISPTLAEHVKTTLGQKVSVIIDGGPCDIGLESTVIGLLTDEPALLRPGGIPRRDIERVLGRALTTNADPTQPLSPGQLESHYAPKAVLRLNASSPKNGEAYLGFGAHNGQYNLSPSGDTIEAAANLFRMLHELDASGAKAIAVAPIPMTGLGEAINDRLSRAAAPRNQT